MVRRDVLHRTTHVQMYVKRSLVNVFNELGMFNYLSNELISILVKICETTRSYRCQNAMKKYKILGNIDHNIKGE